MTPFTAVTPSLAVTSGNTVMPVCFDPATCVVIALAPPSGLSDAAVPFMALVVFFPFDGAFVVFPCPAILVVLPLPTPSGAALAVCAAGIHLCGWLSSLFSGWL